MSISKPRRLPRFLTPEANCAGQALELPEDLMHYASRVLRLLDESEVILWDGSGHEFVANLHYLSKKSAEFRIAGPAERKPPVELLKPVEILQALPESDKMDWVIEKCTEMGAVRFHPAEAARSVVKLKGERADKKERHWQKIAESAGMQSGRMVCPQVEPLADLRTAIERFKSNHPKGRVMMFDPDGTHALSAERSQSRPAEAYLICVGPEGGWTEEEINLAARLGAEVLKFCPRILRTETFALACLSQLTSLFDLEPHSESTQ